MMYTYLHVREIRVDTVGDLWARDFSGQDKKEKT